MQRAFPGTGALTVALVCLLAIFAPAAPGRAGDVQGPRDDTAVRTLWSTLDARWNARDAERFADFFAEDASFEFVDRDERLEDRAQIHAHFAQRFPRFAPDVRHRTQVRGTHAVAPGVRTLDGKVEILRDGPGDGAEPAVLMTFAIFAVMQRTGADWKIRMLRAYTLPTITSDSPPPP